MGQVALKLVVVVAQQQQCPLFVLQHHGGETGKTGCKPLVVTLPELVEIPAAGLGAIAYGDQIGRFNAGQHFGTLQHQVCGQTVQWISEALQDLFRKYPGGWLDPQGHLVCKSHFRCIP